MSAIKILVFTKYHNNGPSSRYRYYNYIDCFRKEEIFTHIVPFFCEKYLSNINFLFKIILALKAYFLRFIKICKLLFSSKYKLVIIEYELFPYFPSIFEKLLSLRKIDYVVDYDDAIFHKYDKSDNPVVRFLLNDKIAKVMNMAKAVIVGNDYLYAYAKANNQFILKLPTVVQLDKYQLSHVKIEKIKKEKNKEKNLELPFVIGWIGSKSTSQYLLGIVPTIGKFCENHNAECHFIGFDDQLISKETLIKNKITTIAWSKETEINDMMNFDVGIMPLKDDPWSKGKCGFKLIQYMSCKKPVIASPVGVNTQIVTNEINGYLAKTADQWYGALEKLYFNKELRSIMANNNWKKIVKHYNHSKNCQKYCELIKDIVNKK